MHYLFLTFNTFGALIENQSARFMKSIHLLLLTSLSLFSISILNAQTHISSLDWAFPAGSISGDGGRAITTDKFGNVISTGNHSDSLDMDPGIDTAFIHPNGTNYIYIQKVNATGDFVWAKTLGSQSEDIVTDTAGNIYVTGRFSSTIDFDLGAGVNMISSNGSSDIFILKLDSNGNTIWVKTIGGAGLDEGTAIELDQNGSIYLTGRFSNTVDFDPGTGVANATSTFSYNPFILKLTNNGDYVWVKTMGGTNHAGGWSLAIDEFENVYTCGYFWGTIDFDPGAGVQNRTAAGQNDNYIQKLDSNGNFTWIRTFGNIFGDFLFEIDLDNQGNVLATGNFTGTVDFNPTSGTFNLTADQTTSSGYVLKLTTNGGFAWAKAFGGTNSLYAYSIQTDQFGSVYSSGNFWGTIDFDPSADSSVLSYPGGPHSDGYIQKLDSNGNFIWVNQLGGTASDITLDDSINLYVTGYFAGSGDFDPDTTNVLNFNAIGSEDLFVLKLDQCVHYDFVDTIVSCGSYTWIDGVTYTSSTSGVVYSGITSIGCDSIVTLHLTIYQDAYDTLTLSECNTYTSPSGKTFTTTGTYSDTIPTIVGCDSILSINLTINVTEFDTIQVSECHSYTWPLNGIEYTSTGFYQETLINNVGCDSIVTLDLTLNANGSDSTVVACNSFDWYVTGITYTTSGVYIDTLINHNGCDSIVTLDLTINSVSDATTSVSGLTITANNLSASYQWIDCSTNSVLTGETASSFTAISNGNYAVVLTENNCSDTSNCVSITSVGLNESVSKDEFRVYPNPTENILNIELSEFSEAVEVIVYDGRGAIVEQLSAGNTKFVSIELNQPAGLYSISIRTKSETYTDRIIVK